jgi:streptomycin 6-kinase
MGANFEPEMSPEARVNAVNMLGAEGAARWEAGLPRRLGAICSARGLRPFQSIMGSTRGILVACAGPDGDVVVKVAFAATELAEEALAMSAWPTGCTAMLRLIERVPGEDAIIVPYVAPARNVDEEATDVPDGSIVALLADLGLPKPEGCRLRLLAEETRERLEKGRGRLAMMQGDCGLREEDIDHALALSESLTASTPEESLVHGDLYPGNVLVKADGGLVACDPKGLVGDRCFDAAMWCVKSDCGRRLAHWQGLFAAVGYDSGRMASWARVLATHDVIAYIHGQKKPWNVPAMLRIARGDAA